MKQGRAITTILITLITFQAVVLPLAIPRRAEAIVPTWDWALSGPPLTTVPAWFVVKEVGVGGVPSPLSWDAVAWFLARTILHEFTQGIITWIQTGQDPFFSGGTEGSLFVTNIDNFLLDAADNAASIFLSEYLGEETYSQLCAPFRSQIGLALGRTYGRGYGSFQFRAQCTITDIVQNLESFYDNFENGGWAAWFASASYANNPWGLLTFAREESYVRQLRSS